MNILDLNQDVQKLILDYLPGKDKASFVNSSQTSLRIAETVDESFKDKIKGRAAIKSLKNRTFAKIVLGGVLSGLTFPLWAVTIIFFLSVTPLYLALKFLCGSRDINFSEEMHRAISLGARIGSLGSINLFFDAIKTSKTIEGFEIKFNKLNEASFSRRITIYESLLFPSGLDFKRQRIDESNDAVESKLKNPALGTFSFMRNNQEIVFDAAYCFDYYGSKYNHSHFNIFMTLANPFYYKRILKVSDGIDSTGKRVDYYNFFGNDKFSVYAVKNNEGVLVLEMKHSIREKDNKYNKKQFIELHLNS